MTRINVIPVNLLTDKHLVAEYKEITRPFNKVIKRIEKHGVDKALADVSIPENYVLGKGHESFFFDKLCWLYIRYRCLFEEMQRRDFNVDCDKYFDIAGNFILELEDTPYWNIFEPTLEDMYLNMARLAKRSNIPTVLDELDSPL